MSLKSRLRPLHMRLRNNTVYEGLYLLFRPAARTPTAVKKPASAAKKASLVLETKLTVADDMSAAGEHALADKILDMLLLDETNSASALLWDAKAKSLLSQANHDAVLDITREMTQERDMPSGHFYAAQSFFARGHDTPAMHHIQADLLDRPNNAASVYLLCEIAQSMGKPALARAALERLVTVSRQAKSWLVLANLVEDDDDYLRTQAAWKTWTKEVMKNAYNKDAREYLALAAMRVGNYSLAKTIWRQSLTAAATRKGGFQSLNIRKPSYSSLRAEHALRDLNTTLRTAEIEMFLVSGTLLGCVRENMLLGHDKDIDVGIWSDVSATDFMKAIHASGQFLMLASRSEHIIRLRHLNGIAVDIFFHYRDPDDYWHAGVKMKWHNTPFTLVERKFLGQTHLIPEDYDTYLTENYGDWRTPMIAFDSAFDTPNGEVLHEDEMVIHAFKGLQNACISGVAGAPEIYLDDLAARGEGSFVEKFRLQVAETDPDTAALLHPRPSTTSGAGHHSGA